MHFGTKLSWDRFVLDLELLMVEDPNSLALLVTQLNSILWPSENQDQALRSINFMCYELMARCQEKNESDRIAELNRYFFEEKGFQISLTNNANWSEEDLLLKNALTHKKGAPITISLIYLHLASQLDLPVYLIHFKNQCVVKWVRGSNSCFMDLASGGLNLSQDQILAMLNQVKSSPDSAPALDILPNKKIFLLYAEQLTQFYSKSKDISRLHMLYNTQLVIEPNNLDLIANRALLRKKMGYVKEAIQDLKRYFSFVDHDHAPLELQTAFQQLQSLADFSERTGMDFLH